MKDLNPFACGIRSFDFEEILPLHHIQRHVLHYVINGSGLCIINGTVHTVTTGDVFVCRPGYVASYKSIGNLPFTYIWVSFDCSNDLAALLATDVLAASWAQSTFEGVLSCHDFVSPELAVCARLYDFFSQLPCHPIPSTSALDDSYVGKALSFIQAHYFEDIQINNLASNLGISRNYFCRLFRQKIGLSPQAYLVSYRLDTAARLLTEQRLSQKEAALQVGYSDVCSFSRMFKRKFGMAPGAYVTNHGKETSNV